MSDDRVTFVRVFREIIGNGATTPHMTHPTAASGDQTMNIHAPDMDREPTREEAEAALALLRRWAGDVTAEEV
ncbi:MAG: GTP cyclohydrolase I FolE2, partial [Pseudomonadota bacterium]